MAKEPLYPHIPKSKLEEAVGIPIERDIREARKLAERAADILKEVGTMRDRDSALWRLVDAAGIIAKYAGTTALGTPLNPTGRHYFIEQK